MNILDPGRRMGIVQKLATQKKTRVMADGGYSRPKASERTRVRGTGYSSTYYSVRC